MQSARVPRGLSLQPTRDRRLPETHRPPRRHRRLLLRPGARQFRRRPARDPRRKSRAARPALADGRQCRRRRRVRRLLSLVSPPGVGERAQDLPRRAPCDDDDDHPGWSRHAAGDDEGRV